MEEQNPYAGPLEPESPPFVGLRKPRFLQAVIEGTASGLVIALFDVNLLDSQGLIILGLFLGGCVLGFRHGFVGGALAWVPLGGLIFPTHLIAMLVFGYQHPYVERDPVSTIASIFVLIPAGMGVFLGAIAGLVWTFVFPTTSSKSADGIVASNKLEDTTESWF